MCRISVNQKHIKGITVDDYWQERLRVDDSASQWHRKTTPEGFPSAQLLSTKLRDRQRKWCEKEKKREKVWVWVNSVYPCHMSLVHPSPHCSLVAANSSSDTKTMSAHALCTHGWVDLGCQRTHVKHGVNAPLTNVRYRLSVHFHRLSLHTSSGPQNKSGNTPPLSK